MRLTIGSILLALLLAAPLGAKTLPPHPAQPFSAATPELKQYMASFGTMFAGLEIMKSEKSVDWEAVDISVQEMSRALAAMQKADSQNRYREYTDILAAGMIDLREKSAKKDKGFFKSVDKVSETCFKCHAANRPVDYQAVKPAQH